VNGSTFASSGKLTGLSFHVLSFQSGSADLRDCVTVVRVVSPAEGQNPAISPASALVVLSAVTRMMSLTFFFTSNFIFNA